MRATFVIAAAAALAGCQADEPKNGASLGEVRLTNATMAQVTEAVRAARAKQGMQGGEWQTDMRIVSVDLSGFPEGDREAQRTAIKAQENSVKGCRTEKDLKPIDLESIAKAAGTCTFPRYIQADGKLDVEIQCGEGATRTVMTAAGTMTSTGFDVTVDQATGTRGAPGSLGLKIQAKGTRLGECKGEAAA